MRHRPFFLATPAGTQRRLNYSLLIGFGEVVKRQLEALPGVTVKRIWGNEDIRLEDIGADIVLADGTQLVIWNLTEKSLEPGGSFNLFRIGDQSPRFTAFGYMGVYETSTGRPVRSRAYGAALHFGSGALAPRMPAGVATVQDLVAQAVAVKAALAAWPGCPSYFDVDQPDGIRYRFCASTPDAYTYPPDFR